MDSDRKDGAGGVFRGTFEDYAKASLLFTAVVDRKGVAGLSSIYEAVSSGGLSFTAALERKLYWDQPRLAKEVMRVPGPNHSAEILLMKDWRTVSRKFGSRAARNFLCLMEHLLRGLGVF